ncbi:MAG: hypothetical protein HUU35_13620, partial [Armatimonadetes bacterium]|nr:hypothetical protein [Armatimonadota bacterium]
MGRLDALEKLTREFRDELTTMGQNVNQMLARITALESKVSALSETVQDHENRISELERLRWFANVRATMGIDGTADQLGPGFNDGDLGFESGEAFSYLSAQAGIDANLGGDMRGRFTWWYDSDGNQHHGRVGTRQAGLQTLGIDEAWVRLPGLGGRWIFGRQYAGQDYETGEAIPQLGLGTGYYTGAALNGIRAQYGLGTFGGVTLLAQADDNIIGGVPGGVLNANVAGVARWDVDLPWWKSDEGEPFVKLGFQTVGHYANNAAPNGAAVAKRFNDGSRSSEWSGSIDLFVNVLKGLHVEYTSQFQDNAGNSGPEGPFDANVDAEGQVYYGELGILDTPTFLLNLKGGLVETDYSLSHSVITNPYVPFGEGVFGLFEKPIILDSFYNFGGVGPTQGFDVDFRWMIGSRPLKIRWAGSTRRLDLFNWMVYGSFPIVQTGKGDVSISGGYVDVDPGHLFAPVGGSSGVVGVRVAGGFSF